MLQFIDTHTHLYDEAFLGEEDDAVARAVDAGVGRMIVPDIDSSTREAMFRFTRRHPLVTFPCLGLHPTSVNAGYRDELDKLFQWEGEQIKAIGEIGLDFYWSTEFAAQQQEALRIQLEYASRKNLPVIIHSRESTKTIIDTLEEFRGRGLRGVMHAFSGSIETFRQIDRTGDWYFGIGGVLTYKKASIAETVKSIPLERILLETDSPYLTPVPFRGKRNESAYRPYIAQRLASIKDCSLEDIASQTTANAVSLFEL